MNVTGEIWYRINKAARSLFSYFIQLSLLWHFYIHIFFLINPEQFSILFFSFTPIPLYTLLWKMILIWDSVFADFEHTITRTLKCIPTSRNMIFNLTLLLYGPWNISRDLKCSSWNITVAGLHHFSSTLHSVWCEGIHGVFFSALITIFVTKNEVSKF